MMYLTPYELAIYEAGYRHAVKRLPPLPPIPAERTILVEIYESGYREGILKRIEK